MKRKEIGVLICIIVIAILLRFWQLGSVPSSVDWDEAALGYNAYSLLMTGKDEYGVSYPLVIRSFDDYKPPLYTYLTIPSVALFGLNAWSVRFVSAVAGVLAVVGTYLLTYELTSYSTLKIRKKSLALISAFLLAISPWHVHFSRIAFEANIGVALNIWAVFFFFKALKKPQFLIFSAFTFGMSLYAYHSERIFSPLIVLILGVIFYKQLLAIKKFALISIIVGAFVVLPTFSVLLDPITLTRLRGTSSLADQTGLLAKSVSRLKYDISIGDSLGRIFDNRRTVWFRTIFDGYISHYSFNWLFIEGDNARHHAPSMGLLYIWEFPFLLLGLLYIAKYGGKPGKLLIGWFFIAPIAASPTTELPHAIRTLVFLPTFQIFTSSGIICLFEVLRKASWKRFAQCIIATSVIVNFLYYMHMYYAHMDNEYSKYWQYGYQQAVTYASTHAYKYDHIIVSTKLEQPYMFFLFYLKYDPRVYLKEGGTASGGFAENKNKFNKYIFRPIDWSHEVKDGKTLYIASPNEISNQGLEIIHYRNGDPAMVIADR